MKIQEMMFVGIKGSVLALDRDSGEQAWVAKVGSDFVTVTVEGEKIFAACLGEIFCLDAFSGNRLWHNPLKGYGTGLATMAFSGASGSAGTVLAEKARQDQAASCAATNVAVMG
jgi:outer membrane protein assembly factor BamB